MSARDKMKEALQTGERMRRLQREFFGGDRTVVSAAKREERLFDDQSKYALNLCALEEAKEARAAREAEEDTKAKG